MKGRWNCVRKSKNDIRKTKLASELSQLLLATSPDPQGTQMSLPWGSSETHSHKDGEKVSTKAWAWLLASADKRKWLFAGVTQHGGTEAEAVLLSIHGRFSCAAAISVSGSSLCKCSRCYWIVSRWTQKVKKNYMIQPDLAASGFNGIIAVYFDGIKIESCTAERSCICPARIWWKKDCQAPNVNITVSSGGFEEKVRVLQTWFGSCKNNTQANRWSLQWGKSLRDSQINELCQVFSGFYQNSYKSALLGREVETGGINNFPRQLVYPRLADKELENPERNYRGEVSSFRKAKATASIVYYQCSGD